jgi:hypothetical protein
VKEATGIIGTNHTRSEPVVTKLPIGASWESAHSAASIKSSASRASAF